MYQFFSKPDACIGRTGDLRCAVVERPIDGAPAFMDGLRVLFVSDFHAVEGTSTADMERLIQRMAEARPDLLLLGGDCADRPVPALRLLRAMGRLKPLLGGFAVVGNNDREAFEDLKVLRRAMADSGIVLLVNEARALNIHGGRLVIAGLDEYHHGHPEPAGLVPPAGTDTFRILLSHYPIAVAPMPDLMLSGHTHGGQFNLLGLTPYTIGFERIFSRRASRFIAGFHPYGGGRMLVSKGIGASRIPLRIGVRPEMDLLVFGKNQ